MILNNSTTKRFNINRGVRQGCPIAPFLFLLVLELLTIGIVNNDEIQGLTFFDNILKISQLADDSTLFFKKNVYFIPHAISFINDFSRASGLTLNVSKYEILPLHTINDKYIMNIPVKSSIKYLGIVATKIFLERQNLIFSSRLKKTKAVLNCWLPRDLSIYGRALLSKAEGLSQFVYPLHVKDSNCKDINNLFFSFIWKNKSQRLKKGFSLIRRLNEVWRCFILRMYIRPLRLIGLRDV